jgi:membrane protein implicated in regulation of membrane protease activity
MSVKILGLDWFDVVVHAVVTVAVGVAVDSLFPGRVGEAGIGAVIAGSVILLGWRRRRARDLEPAEMPDQLADLESRVAELEGQQHRVVELEDRLDFAERLLIQQREHPPLGQGAER